MLYRLVCGSVFAVTHGIVREDEDGGQLARNRPCGFTVSRNVNNRKLSIIHH